MYVFIDKDISSLTFGLWCVRQGSFSYDGFKNEQEAIIFLNELRGG